MDAATLDCLALFSKRCFEFAQDISSDQQGFVLYFSSVKSKANGRLIQKLDENSARRCRVFTQVKIEQTTNSG